MENQHIEPVHKDGQLSKRLIQLSYIYAIIITSLVWFLNSQNPKGFAIVSLAIGLFLLWGLFSAYLMKIKKESIKHYFDNKHLSPFLIVTLGGILLALIEEAFATFMTNLAPLFGFSTSEVYITASANYIDVVTRHSVIVFIPWFFAWGLILNKYSIHPNTVFILFGFTGLFAEVLAFGPQHITEVGFWIVIYGLMIYIPSYIVYNPDPKRMFKPLFYPLLVIVPFLMMVLWTFIILFVFLIIS